MTPHLIQRNGDGPMEFTGELIGFATNRHTKPTWTNVSVYRTSGGQYVAVVERWSTDSRLQPFHTKAHACPSVADLLRFLSWDPKGRGGVTRAALAEAAKVDHAVRMATMIRVV